MSGVRGGAPERRAPAPAVQVGEAVQRGVGSNDLRILVRFTACWAWTAGERFEPRNEALVDPDNSGHEFLAARCPLPAYSLDGDHGAASYCSNVCSCSSNTATHPVRAFRSSRRGRRARTLWAGRFGSAAVGTGTSSILTIAEV